MENCLILNVRIILHQKQFSHVFQTTHIWFITKCHCSSPFHWLPPTPFSPPACAFLLYFLSICLSLVILVGINFLISLHKLHFSCYPGTSSHYTSFTLILRTGRVHRSGDSYSSWYCKCFSSGLKIEKKKKVCEVSSNNFCAY